MGVLQKVHQTSALRAQKPVFLLVAFATAALLCGILAFFPSASGKSPEKRERTGFTTALWVILFLTGLSLTMNHVINLHLAGVLPSAVFYPAFNGGATALSVLTALFVFRERLTKRKLIALFISLVALCLLILPQFS